MDKPRTTPKDFFLWAGAMIALYASAIAFISLVFNYLNYALPDPLQYFASDPYRGGISYEMASLIVLVPLAVWLLPLIQRGIRRDPSRADIWVRRWALYLTLFVAAATLAGDLITLVMYFFNGDVTPRFFLKVLLILLVAGGGFLYFLADLRGYWAEHPAKCRIVAWATGVLVVATIAAGFFIIGTPWQARLYRFDEEKVNDLQHIQSQVVSYWQAKQVLPNSLSDLNDEISGFVVPVDPQTGQPFEYQKTGTLSFRLCANFNAPTQQYASSGRAPVAPAPYAAPNTQNDTWYHGAGAVCFDRTVDPSRYPPLNKKPQQ